MARPLAYILPTLIYHTWNQGPEHPPLPAGHFVLLGERPKTKSKASGTFFVREFLAPPLD